MILQKLAKQGVIHPPSWLPDNCAFLGITGSQAYAVTSDNSDNDVVGYCFPLKTEVFPHLRENYIHGFGRQIQRFNDWTEHHCLVPGTKKSYDFTVYSIVKYFQLAMENNPNIIDTLFLPQRCILHNTEAANIVRENRKLFLHKGAWHKFKGYAYSMLHKIDLKVNSTNPKRAKDIEENGYDTKFAYHLVRLLLECEQILIEHDLDLERNKEQLKSIRRGEWTIDQLKEYFKTKELFLEGVYAESTLPHSPDENKIKKILLQCLESHYGSLTGAVTRKINVDQFISDVQQVIDRYRS